MEKEENNLILQCATPNSKKFLSIVDSARDIEGHGTFVSSIAAGNYVNGVSYFGYGEGTAKGVAPNVRISVYKVGWGVDAIGKISDIITGVDMAIEDGVDVICIAMASKATVNAVPLLEPIARASFSTMEKGILAVVNLSKGEVGNRLKLHLKIRSHLKIF